jgi:hypothetical protein
VVDSVENYDLVEIGSFGWVFGFALNAMPKRGRINVSRGWSLTRLESIGT